MRLSCNIICNPKLSTCCIGVVFTRRKYEHKVAKRYPESVYRYFAFKVKQFCQRRNLWRENWRKYREALTLITGSQRTPHSEEILYKNISIA